MATEAGLKNAISEAVSALNGIVNEAKKFAYEHVTDSSNGGWNDSYGKKISRAIVSSVEDAVDSEMHFLMSDYISALEDMESLASVIAKIKDADKELRK